MADRRFYDWNSPYRARRPVRLKILDLWVTQHSLLCQANCLGTFGLAKQVDPGAVFNPEFAFQQPFDGWVQIVSWL